MVVVVVVGNGPTRASWKVVVFAHVMHVLCCRCARQVEVVHIPEMLSSNDHMIIFGVGKIGWGLGGESPNSHWHLHAHTHTLLTYFKEFTKKLQLLNTEGRFFLEEYQKMDS